MGTHSSRALWMQNLLEALEASGPEGASAALFLRTRETRLGFHRVRPHVGAFWTPWRSIGLNLVHFTEQTPGNDPQLLALVIHEVRHLQQGLLTALSVYGELDAWQLQFRELERMTVRQSHPALRELLSLPLGWERDVLRRARDLMQAYAGKGYRADLLPLYPLPHEIAYRLFRRQPPGA